MLVRKLDDGTECIFVNVSSLKAEEVAFLEPKSLYQAINKLYETKKEPSIVFLWCDQYCSSVKLAVYQMFVLALCQEPTE